MYNIMYMHVCVKRTRYHNTIKCLVTTAELFKPCRCNLRCENNNRN